MRWIEPAGGAVPLPVEAVAPWRELPRGWERSRHNSLLLHVLYTQMPEDMAEADPDERVAKMSNKEKVAFFSNALFKRYKKDEPEKLLVCMTTLRVYIVNAKDNPTEPKYHRIR